jgi:K+-sensing histidine kinase KdpD
MSNNIEARLPFLDVNFAKYCFNLKNSLKIKDNAGGLTAAEIAQFMNVYRGGQVQGTGIGLRFCALEMQKINGKIEAHLIDGDCVEFLLYFPKLV